MTPETAIRDIAELILVFADAFRVVAIKRKLSGNEYSEVCLTYAGNLARLFRQLAEPLKHFWRADNSHFYTGRLSNPLLAELCSPQFWLKFDPMRQEVQVAYPPPFDATRILRDPGSAPEPGEPELPVSPPPGVEIPQPTKVSARTRRKKRRKAKGDSATPKPSLRTITLNADTPIKTAEQRRTVVDTYLELAAENKKLISRTHIWKTGGYNSRAPFERWQRADPKSSKRANRVFRNLLLIEQPHLH